METLAKRIEKDGFAIVPGVLPIDEVEILIEAVQRVSKSSSHKRGGIRNLLNKMIEVRLLANSEPVLKLVKAVLGPNAFVVNGILFDKAPQANWKVSNRIEVQGSAGSTLPSGQRRRTFDATLVAACFLRRAIAQSSTGYPS